VKIKKLYISILDNSKNKGVRGENKPARSCCFGDREINPVTWQLEGDLNTLKMYFHTKNKVASLRHSKLKAWIGKNMYQDQNVKNSKLLQALS